MTTLETAQKQWQDIQKRIKFMKYIVLIIELTTAVNNRQKLESQLQENSSVQNVFLMTIPNSGILKLISGCKNLQSTWTSVT